MNTNELTSALYWAESRVLEIQTKLHRWARQEPHRRFDDLFNLVADPAFLMVAWDRVRGNKGARTAGVDGRTAVSIQAGQGVGEFLDGLSPHGDRGSAPATRREAARSGGCARCHQARRCAARCSGHAHTPRRSTDFSALPALGRG